MGTSTCSRAQSCLLSASTTEIPTVSPKKDKRMCVPGNSDPWCPFPLRLQLTTFIWSLDGTTLGKESEPREIFPERQKTWSGWTPSATGSIAPRRKTMVAHVRFVTFTSFAHQPHLFTLLILREWLKIPQGFQFLVSALQRRVVPSALGDFWRPGLISLSYR